MAEMALIDAVASQQMITEVERNLGSYLPAQLPALRLILARCLRIVPDPTIPECAAVQGLADPKDISILAAAVREICPWLVTFNLRHFLPGHPRVRATQPGTLVQEIRSRLAQLP
jgi:hypothetical protein